VFEYSTGSTFEAMYSYLMSIPVKATATEDALKSKGCRGNQQGPRLGTGVLSRLL
jgi:hypothetical protein